MTFVRINIVGTEGAIVFTSYCFKAANGDVIFLYDTCYNLTKLKIATLAWTH